MRKLIKSLIKNLEKPEHPQEVDLIIDGGGFKAAYIVGNLLYLKEMEKQGFLKISRISGTSVGSLLGLLYFLDNLNIIYKLLPVLSKDYKKTNKLTNSFKLIKRYLSKIIGEKGMKSFNKRLYINYYDLKNNRDILSNTYSNIDNIFKKIHFSCFLPFMFDGRPSICDKIDGGFTPFIFPKRDNVKILFLSAISIRNIRSFNETLYTDDKNITYKMTQGVLDMHSFYIDKPTTMSYYIENNSIYSTGYFICRKILLYVIVFLIHIYNIIQNKTNVSRYFFFAKKVFETTRHAINSTF
jgi:hypothetical protein